MNKDIINIFDLLLDIFHCMPQDKYDHSSSLVMFCLYFVNMIPIPYMTWQDIYEYEFDFSCKRV